MLNSTSVKQWMTTSALTAGPFNLDEKDPAEEPGGRPAGELKQQNVSSIT